MHLSSLYIKKAYRTVILLVCTISIPILTSAQSNKKLQHELEKMVAGFNGSIGIYVKDLRTGKTVSINADTVFPTASIVKVPILTGVMQQIENGLLSYNQELLYTDSLFYAGSDILGSFKNNEKILLKKVIMLMMTTSDNTASLWLQKLAGTGAAINNIMEKTGLTYTRVNSRTPGREDNRTQYGWGQTTPYEMATLMEKIYRRQIISIAACDRMLRCMGRNYWDENEAISQIPPTIEVFSKNGCVNQSRNEILLVNGPNNPYIFSIFTKNNKDSSWTAENEAWALTRKISARLWQYFEPKYKWPVK